MLDVSTKEARAKFYGSTKWRHLRQQRLERDHYECQWCKAEGKTTTTGIFIPRDLPNDVGRFSCVLEVVKCTGTLS